MVRVNFDIDDSIYIELKNKIEEGNLSSFFRQYAKSYVGGNINLNENKLREDLKKIEKEYNKIYKKRQLIIKKLDIIELKKQQKKREKAKKLKKQKDKMADIKHDTVKTHLSEVI